MSLSELINSYPHNPAFSESLNSRLAQLTSLSPFSKKALLNMQEDEILQWSVLCEMEDEIWLAHYFPAIDADLDEAQFMQAIRNWRAIHQTAIIEAINTQAISLERSLSIISLMAQMAIKLASQFAHKVIEKQYGLAGIDEQTNKHNRLSIIGMGKLGAKELNLSSDIDLIFIYQNEGESLGEKSISHEEYFTKVGRKIIHFLDQQTVDGRVYRVDMRLRPWGQSGPLAMNYASFFKYYENHGRDWERFAFIKARVLCGEQAQMVEQRLKQFVFRRYVDFHAVDALRDMKKMINNEVIRLGKQQNIKLGKGGIREIEFIVQVFQLIRGGQDLGLQQRNIFLVLEEIKQLELLPANVVSELVEDYTTLRLVEHGIQAIDDEQSQTIKLDELFQQRLACIAGFSDVQIMQKTLADVSARVTGHFNDVIAVQSSDESLNTDIFEDMWQEPQRIVESFAKIEHEFLQFAKSKTVLGLSDEAKSRLDRFMPLYLKSLHGIKDYSLAFERTLPIIESILRRSTYLVLLSEHPDAIDQMVLLCSLSVWVSEKLRVTPFLLDELTDRKQLYQLPDKIELADQLRQIMLRVLDDDQELQMETLRHFKHSRGFRAAACEITGLLSTSKISDYLVWVAEVVLAQVVRLSRNVLVEKFGSPCSKSGEEHQDDFAVIGYGKLGGIEMSYESDLDIVFIHNGDSAGSTNGHLHGKKQIENAMFYTRLAQKIIHMIGTKMHSGELYEVDMRLRPSGNSGMLVSSCEAFKRYQNEKAWVWEHQALVRARFITGSSQGKEFFDECRKNILQNHREVQTLKAEVVKMKQKMQDHLGTKEARRPFQFHMKHDSGGIVDIEFLVQYLTLLQASQHHELCQWSDNQRQLKALAKAGMISNEQKEQLLHAYLAFRSLVHKRLLQNQSNRIEVEELEIEFKQHRQNVQDCWQYFMIS